jgi:hypothetical protein
METFNLKKLKACKEESCVMVSNSSEALEDLDAEGDINSA